MLDGQGYDISCDLVMKVSVGGVGKKGFYFLPDLQHYFHYYTRQ